MNQEIQQVTDFIEPEKSRRWNSVLDGILLERRGIPVAAICTDSFVPNGRAIAAAHGAPGYPFILVPHPLASASPEELAREAKTVLPEVLRLLIRG